MTARLKLGVALLGLAVCLAAPVLFFNGSIGEAAYRQVLLGGTAVWFVFATLHFTRR